MEDSIFIQIASYRDPQLVLTIRNCLEMADHPERLSFGICWQYDKSENIDAFDNNSQFRILKIGYESSLGACWARRQTQKLYQDEKYTLQLDSHHRFKKGWDTALVAMINQIESPKPILTGYLPSFDPESGNHSELLPSMMVVRDFPTNGVIYFSRQVVHDSQLLHSPFSARFCSGHFIFTTGQFCNEVPYDPECYFIGEEISLAVRAFTHGYDLFHPNEEVIWHAYGGSRPRHWDDHHADNNLEPWVENAKISDRRVRNLLQIENTIENLAPYGLGGIRTLQEYQMYSGINFHLKAIHQDVLANVPPPTTPSYTCDEDWIRNCEIEFSQRIIISKKIYDQGRSNGWVISFFDKKKNLINEQIISKEFANQALALETPQLLLFYRSFTQASSWSIE